MKRILGPLLLFLLLVGLVIAVTWPWVRAFASGFLVHWDPPFHAWKLNLVAESILQGHVFPPGRTTNVFFPSSLTLYYEALHWPQAVLAAGLRLFTDNVVLVYHLVFVAFWAFSGVCFFWLLRELGAGVTGSVLGAAVFVAMPFRISYIFEFNMQLCFGMILFLLFLFRFLRAPGFANALGLSLAFWAQAASELYLALIMTIVSPLLVAPSLRALPLRGLTWKSWSGIGAALLFGGGLSWYFLWPYRVLNHADDFSRSLQEMGRHFVEPLSYLSGFISRTFLPWVDQVRKDELLVYPGTLVLIGALLYAVLARKILRPPTGGHDAEPRLLSGIRFVRLGALVLLVALAVALDTFATAGAAASWASGLFNALLFAVPSTSLVIALAAPGADPAARARSGLAVAASLAFALSLGPKIVASNSGWFASNETFVQLYRHLPLLGGMRVVSRFAIVVLVFLLVAAVAGWEALCRRWPRVRWTTPLVVLLVCAEARPGTVRTVPFDAPWRSPALAAMEHEPEAPLLVLPFGDRNWDSQYMLGIAGSRRRLLYGWGGFYPSYQQRFTSLFRNGDFAEVLTLLRQVWPSPYLLLDRWHLENLGRRNETEIPWAQLESELAAACEPVAADDRFALFKVRSPASPAVVYQRITRHDVLVANPTIVFTARAAAGGDLPVAVAVNGSILGRFDLSGEPVVYALTVPADSLEVVYPNAIQIGSSQGGDLVVGSFALAPAGHVPAGARAIAADLSAHHRGPWPAWLGSLGELPEGARSAVVDFRNGIGLSGYAVASETVRPGEPLELSYFVTFDQDISFGRTPTLVTRLQVGDRILAQDDFEPTVHVDRSAVRAQPYQKYFRIDRRLHVPAEAPAGRYEIRAGLRKDKSGPRFRGASNLAEHHRWYTLPGSIEILPDDGR